MGSALLLLPAFGRAGAIETPLVRLALLSVLFLVFVAAPLLGPWLERQPARRLDLALVVGNAAGYMTAVYVTFERWRPGLEAPYAVALAAL